MPDIHPFRRLRLWTLKEARDQGQILVITCNFCRVTHRYLPDDLVKLCGDITLDRVLTRFKCEGCGKKHYLRMELHFPNGSEYGHLEIRRLTDIRTVTIPIWADDVLH